MNTVTEAEARLTQAHTAHAQALAASRVKLSPPAPSAVEVAAAQLAESESQLVEARRQQRQKAVDDLAREAGTLEGAFVAAVLALPGVARLAEINDALQLASKDESIAAGRSGWALTSKAAQLAGLGARAAVLVEAVKAQQAAAKDGQHA